jgi:serine/threonine protein kinase
LNEFFFHFAKKSHYYRRKKEEIFKEKRTKRKKQKKMFYRILETLHKRNERRVYLAEEDTDEKKQVILKRLTFTSSSASPAITESATKAESEAEAEAEAEELESSFELTLSHYFYLQSKELKRYLMPCHDLFVHQSNKIMMVFAKADGNSLDQWLPSYHEKLSCQEILQRTENPDDHEYQFLLKKSWSFEQKVSIIQDIAIALHILMKICPGLVHNDVKPQNILLFHSSSSCSEEEIQIEWHAKLCDFGLATFFSTPTTESATVPYRMPAFYGKHYIDRIQKQLLQQQQQQRKKKQPSLSSSSSSFLQFIHSYIKNYGTYRYISYQDFYSLGLTSFMILTGCSCVYKRIRHPSHPKQMSFLNDWFQHFFYFASKDFSICSDLNCTPSSVVIDSSTFFSPSCSSSSFKEYLIQSHQNSLSKSSAAEMELIEWIIDYFFLLNPRDYQKRSYMDFLLGKPLIFPIRSDLLALTSVHTTTTTADFATTPTASTTASTTTAAYTATTTTTTASAASFLDPQKMNDMYLVAEWLFEVLCEFDCYIKAIFVAFGIFYRHWDKYTTTTGKHDYQLFACLCAFFAIESTGSFLLPSSILVYTNDAYSIEEFNHLYMRMLGKEKGLIETEMTFLSMDEYYSQMNITSFYQWLHTIIYPKYVYSRGGFNHETKQFTLKGFFQWHLNQQNHLNMSETEYFDFITPNDYIPVHIQNSSSNLKLLFITEKMIERAHWKPSIPKRFWNQHRIISSSGFFYTITQVITVLND